MPRIIIMTKTGTPRQVSLGNGRTTIGRTARNTLVFDSPLVSRSHAAIDVIGIAASVTDLESSNGTLVNGKKIQMQVLKNRDLLEIGDVQLRFLSAGDEAPEVEPLALAPDTDFRPIEVADYPRTIVPRR